MIGVLGLIAMFVTMAAGMPIGLGMGLIGFLGSWALSNFDLSMSMMEVVPFRSAASYFFSVVPLFLLMGELAFHSGISRNAYFTAYRWVGHLPGGLAIATISGCAGFSAVCGSTVATAATMVPVALPEMNRYKYDPKLALGCIAAGGTIGTMIPPSLDFVIYGIIAQQSIGKLFIAGIFPGLILTGLFMLVIYVISNRRPSPGPPGPRSNWRQRLVAIKDLWGIMVLVVLVMGGIWAGVFTPTEAAALGSFAVFVIGVVTRQAKIKNVVASLKSTACSCGMVLIILIGALIFSYFMALSKLPVALGNVIVGLRVPSLFILLSILAIYLILGCLMDPIGMVLLTIPIFLPIIKNLGFDPIWFGVLVVLMMEMAMITPPVGINVFVIGGMAGDVPLYAIFRGIMPFVVAQAVCLAIVMAFPQIALFLPNIMMGR